MRFFLRLCLVSVTFYATSSWALTPVPEKIVCAITDKQSFTEPEQSRLTGWLGARIDANETNRLLKVDVDYLLDGFRKRPSRQTYDGEHVGKWLHAATLAWANTGDPALRKKLDYTAAELIKCQEKDGYLGTYLDKDRWTEWDVWSHKYNLIGLLTYVRYTGNMESLTACRRMGDLLCETFGDGPGKRDIIKAGWHAGMAPTSVLEPMVLLYRLTGEQRYLDFCKYILRAWEEPEGPKIISTLLTEKRVDKVGDAKAYEMLSCLNGALEYYRTVGDPRILEACLNAWKDITQNRLYITGASSYYEVFHDDFDFPNVANVGETCVTVTWLQFNAQLLRVTGEARFAEQLEHVVFNQLLGAESCDGSEWGYYVQMEGTKPFTSKMMNGNCCLSSGPRGIALIPTFAVCTDADGVVVNLYDAGTAKLSLLDRTPVTLFTETRYPADGQIRITVEPRVIVGDHKNAGKAAVLYGPLVLAAQKDLLAGQFPGVRSVALPTADVAALDINPETAPDRIQYWPGARVFRVNAISRRPSVSAENTPVPIRLIPFADAGNQVDYRIWLPVGPSVGDLLVDQEESYSRPGNVSGSITDGNPKTFVVTYDGQLAREDWFAVTLEAPTEVKRVTFVHGKTFHDGGWFDASAGKPQVQTQTSKDGPWTTVAFLADYPSTTATSSAGLIGGERFACQLPKAAKVYGLRVIGKPASGDNPQQSFSSCAEIIAE
jgi:DUF1680 family protein